MASIKIILYKHKIYKDGSHPVILQAISNGRIKRRVLFSLHPEHWNETDSEVLDTHKDCVKFNIIINNHLHDARSQLLSRMAKKTPIDVDALISSKGDGSLRSSFDQHIQDLQDQNKHSSSRKYLNVRDKCEDFREDTSINDIDIHWIKGFHRYLLRHDQVKAPGTIYRYIKFLKTVLRNEAERGNFNDFQVLAFKVNPGSTERIALKQEELQKIKELSLPDDLISVVRDAFILQIHLRGIRIGDLLQLQKTNIHDNRIKYQAQKTGKFYDIELTGEARRIINKYPGTYILPLLKMAPGDPKQDRAYQKHISVMTAVVNKYLKVIAAMASINKRITSHVARHTFAHIADMRGISLVSIQQMLGHGSASQTDTYLKSLRKSSELDTEARKIFDL